MSSSIEPKLVVVQLTAADVLRTWLVLALLLVAVAFFAAGAFFAAAVFLAAGAFFAAVVFFAAGAFLAAAAFFAAGAFLAAAAGLVAFAAVGLASVGLGPASLTGPELPVGDDEVSVLSVGDWRVSKRSWERRDSHAEKRDVSMVGL